MVYDFDTVVNRRGLDSYKWDIPENELPMWVADMDFKTAPEIRNAMKQRLEHGVFGYNIVRDEWYDSIIGWWKSRHHVTFEKDWLMFCTGVVPAISSIVRKMTTIGEKVLVQTPVYNIFFNSIVNNGRYIVESPLVYDNEQNTYNIDFEDLENKLSDSQVTMMILCNPHNPIGKIWDRETLERIGELCWKYHVLVLSDEIHCDLTYPDKEYVPFASVSEKCKDNSITCIAPTKTFNIAGLQTACVCVPNPQLRHKVNRGLNTDEVAEPNSFAIEAAIAAFTKGEPWLEQLREYLQQNKEYVKAYLEEKLPKLKLVASDATYLLWIDCNALGDVTEFCRFLRENTGLYVSSGISYGESGKDFMRFNIACPKATLIEGMKRLCEGVNAWEKSVKKQ